MGNILSKSASDQSDLGCSGLQTEDNPLSVLQIEDCSLLGKIHGHHTQQNLQLMMVSLVNAYSRFNINIFWSICGPASHAAFRILRILRICEVFLSRCFSRVIFQFIRCKAKNDCQCKGWSWDGNCSQWHCQDQMFIFSSATSECLMSDKCLILQ